MAEQPDKKKLRSLAAKIVFQVAFFLTFLLFIHLEKQNSPNRDDVKLSELRQLSSQTPLYPGFIELATYDSSRATDAGIFKHFYSPASYQSVREFYSALLLQKGWKISKERNLKSNFGFGPSKSIVEYQKGELFIYIEYDSKDPVKFESNYSINFSWHSENSPAR